MEARLESIISNSIKSTKYILYPESHFDEWVVPVVIFGGLVRMETQEVKMERRKK
jgi:hypothetical protein